VRDGTRAASCPIRPAMTNFRPALSGFMTTAITPFNAALELSDGP
jgi:hypothetical protein